MDVDNIRKDFPILNENIKGKPVAYFDNACMALRPKQVVDAMNEYYYKYPGCAGRSIHKIGNMVTENFEKAREAVGRFIGTKNEKEVIFTRNSTESLNLVANAYGFEKGDVVITSDREHNSNLLPWQLLSKSRGIKHEIVFSNPDDMTFDLGEFQRKVESVSDDLKMVSIVHTSNLDGYTLPLKDIIDITHDAGALVMVDGAQSVPHKEMDVKKMDIDFLAFSGHKMMGPSGIGVLYGKYELLEKMSPFLIGGDTVRDTTYQEHVMLPPPEKYEAGLQNYAGAIGLAEAARYLQKIGFDEIEKHERKLNTMITDGIKDIKGISILGPQDPALRSGVVSFNIEGMFPHDIAMMLDDMENIMIRSGAHCVHSWFNNNAIRGSARASLYLYNTEREAKLFVETLKKVAELVK